MFDAFAILINFLHNEFNFPKNLIVQRKYHSSNRHSQQAALSLSKYRAQVSSQALMTRAKFLFLLVVIIQASQNYSI